MTEEQGTALTLERVAEAKATSSLVVATKVKDFISGQDCRTAGDFIEALNEKVEALIANAVVRCKSNQRGTVRASDL